MSNTIDFYFDYSSPYGFLASERIESIAASNDYTVVWRPILLGAVFKVTGQTPLTEAPLKGDYSIMDFTRSAREQKLNYSHPEKFPIGAVAACRATLWLRENTDASLQALTGNFIHEVYRAYFTDNKDITNPEIIAEVAGSMGIDVPTMASALTEQAVKDLLRSEVESAIANGVFGSPMMIVNGEKFWGNDRLDQMERWLQSGGW